MTTSSETSAIFVSDGSAEAERLSDALRLRGYAVVDVPLSLLVARAAVQRPALVLVDVEAEGARAVVARLRGLPGAESIPLLFVGEQLSADMPDSLAYEASGFLPRPLDLRTSMAKIEQLVGSAMQAREASVSGRLSPELESLLRQAEDRLDIEPFSSGPPIPSPEEEVAAVLPPEVLAALDEPLSDHEDDFSQAGENEASAFRDATDDPTPLGPRALLESKTESYPARPTVAPRLAGIHALITPEPPGPAPIPQVPLPPLSPQAGARATTLPPFPVASPGMPRMPRAPVAHSAPPALPSPPEASAPSSSPSQGIPQVLGEGEMPAVLASAIARRLTGALCFDSPEGIRRILLRDGDLVTASSGIDDESLLAFLVARGDLPKATGTQLRGKLPAFGRRAGAALIAYGHLEQDQLWPVLRAHAEWIIACALVAPKATCSLETEVPERLQAEPSVFGGATGAEVLVEIARRVIPIEQAIASLGGMQARIGEGSRPDLLSECALPEPESAALMRIKGGTVGELAANAPSPELPTVLYVLVLLGVLTAVPAPEGASPSPKAALDPLDAEALRSRVRARLDLVHDGDYFAVLGVARNATAYEVRRAYLELRRAFEPSRVLTAATADLADDMRLIVEVLDEAYEILRDSTRRERYRRAIEAGPPR